LENKKITVTPPAADSFFQPPIPEFVRQLKHPLLLKIKKAEGEMF
jgi:hypothetical protein